MPRHRTGLHRMWQLVLLGLTLDLTLVVSVPDSSPSRPPSPACLPAPQASKRSQEACTCLPWGQGRQCRGPAPPTAGFLPSGSPCPTGAPNPEDLCQFLPHSGAPRNILIKLCSLVFRQACESYGFSSIQPEKEMPDSSSGRQRTSPTTQLHKPSSSTQRRKQCRCGPVTPSLNNGKPFLFAFSFGTGTRIPERKEKSPSTSHFLFLRNLLLSAAVRNKQDKRG